MEEILTQYCEHLPGTDTVQIQYRFIKELVSQYHSSVPQTIYNVILQKLVDTIDDILLDHPEFSMNIYLKDIVLKDVHRHRGFILQIASVMKAKYQDKLKICNIHNAPFVFQQIFTIINPFIDKKTKQKIIVNSQLDSSELAATSSSLPPTDGILVAPQTDGNCC